MNKINKNQMLFWARPALRIVSILSSSLTVFLSFGILSCSDFLDLQPTDKVTPDNIFQSEEGIQAYLANMYYNLPIEDFNFYPIEGFNPADANTAAGNEWNMTDDALRTVSDAIISSVSCNNWWEPGYRFNKDVNLFFSFIPNLTITEDKKKQLYGEAYFMRAFTYFTLARRYGGVPIITSIADVSDTIALYVPRSTEKETWDFALESCDLAVKHLGEDLGKRRGFNKYTALALKSRVALHAASVAKYWNKAPLSGRAVDEKLVGGFTQEDALNYYDQCIDACLQIVNDGKFSLYKQNPATPEEAAENYRLMFENPNNALEEVILIKGFDRTGQGYGCNQDHWGNPMQTGGSWPYPGCINPTLDLIDQYECYSNPGHASPIVTTTDGIIDNYSGYNASRIYLTFDNPEDIFKDKDARMHATVITPNSMWKGVKIIIQGGYIQPDGRVVIEADESIEVGGVTYYTFGASAPALYSGFNPFNGNYTRTGFSFRKFMNSAYVPVLAWNYCTTDWIAFRYAEVLLNYAEAVAESGHGDVTLAAQALNALRQRAGHKTAIPLTLENVLRERRVELAFENGRQWDLIRRREFHEKFNNSIRTSLVPVLDLRNMKYIFIRQHVSRSPSKTFLPKSYYNGIPAAATNKLIQNPQY